MQYSVSIVNPSLIAREGLSRIINDGGLVVRKSACSIDELRADEDDCGDLVLLDFADPDEQLRSVDRLAELSSRAKAMVLADRFNYTRMMECFDRGVQGYAVKDVPCSTLIALLHLAILGHKVVPSDVVDLLQAEGISGPTEYAEKGMTTDAANLSNREHDVLCCLMAGYPNKLIARKLDVSEATVKVHVKAILRKLNVMNRTQAALWATSRGIGAVETADG